MSATAISGFLLFNRELTGSKVKKGWDGTDKKEFRGVFPAFMCACDVLPPSYTETVLGDVFWW